MSADADVADWRTAVVRQCADLCATCIYRPGNLAHLAPGRVKQLTQAAIAEETHIVCHDTLDAPAAAICAGFARHPVGAARCLALRLVRAGVLTLQLIVPPSKEIPCPTVPRAAPAEHLSDASPRPLTPTASPGPRRSRSG
ncbi:hypothetical protein [Streptomyces sp. NPDC051016]|uniref:hypothetical protein n=1 Tax=Streptomyces sp. NPDC051016 TaxID=3365638 RepID=UPI0037AFBBDC